MWIDVRGAFAWSGLVSAIRLPYGNGAQGAFVYEVSFCQFLSLLFSDLA